MEPHPTSSDAPAHAQALPPGFNGLEYIASYPDLVTALGADAAAGERHYLSSGAAEGRAADTFDEVDYLARYPDLQAAFDVNVDVGVDVARVDPHARVGDDLDRGRATVDLVLDPAVALVDAVVVGVGLVVDVGLDRVLGGVLGRAADVGLAVVGEIGLTGVVRAAPGMAARISAARAAGLRTVFVPEGTEPADALQSVPVRHVMQALTWAAARHGGRTDAVRPRPMVPKWPKEASDLGF